MKTFNEMIMDVECEMIDYRAIKLSHYSDRREEDIPTDFGQVYRFVLCNAKVTETDPADPVKAGETAKGTRRPGNRADRRKATEHKKNRLGRMVRHANEYINTYIVEKDANGNKKTRWIDDIIKENPEELGDIDWSKVKGINPKNCGFGRYCSGKSPELIKSRHDGKEICRSFVKEDVVYREDYIIDTNQIDETDIADPWAYTDDELRELDGDCLHGDFDDSATEKIIRDRHEWEFDDDDFGFDPYQSALDSALDDREDAWYEIADLKREIAKYKDFIGEFNLKTLYERWLADNSDNS